MKRPSVLFIVAILLWTGHPTQAQEMITPPRSSHVQMHQGRPTLFIDGVPLYPMLYALTDTPGGRWSWEELPQHNLTNFCTRGVRLFQVDLFLDHVWFADGRLDIEMARRQVAGVLTACPEAGVFFRFHVNAPKWWMRQHPEEWVVYADTDYEDERSYGLLRIIEDDNHPVRRVSMASEAWRTAATEKLQQFLHAFAETPEGNALVGIQVANGVYGEWHNWGFYYHEPDVSAPMTDAFRTWLRQKYRTAAALRAAWNDPSVTFETAQVPGMADRATQHGVFRNPTQERNVIDYYTCVHQVVADNIIHFAGVVKAHWPRPIVTGTFYGYFFSVFGRQAAGGHLQLQRLLEADVIDYLSGPQAYEPESIALGAPYRSRGLLPSIRLHGKLWLDEMDVEATIPTLRDARHERLLQNSIAGVRRNVTFSYTKGMGLWFYDFGLGGVDLDGFRYKHKGSQGTWDHPAVMADIEALKRLLEARMETPYRTEADVLFVYDTESFYHTASLRGTDPVSNTLIDYNTLNAFKSGVVFEPIHLDDLDRVDLSRYRVVVFGNTYLLSEAQRSFIDQHVARNGRHVVWFYAPGYTDGQTLSPEAIGRLTGIKVTPFSLEKAPEIEWRFSADSSFTHTVGEEAFGPLFAVTDPDAEPLGYYTETGQVAVARKALATHTAWYVGLPSKALPPMQYLLEAAGAHRYNDRGDIFYAGGGLLVMHTLEGGRRPVTLKDGRRLWLDLPDGAATILLDAETGEVLLGHETP